MLTLLCQDNSENIVYNLPPDEVLSLMESGTSFSKGSGHLILALQGWQSFGETKAGDLSDDSTSEMLSLHTKALMQA